MRGKLPSTNQQLARFKAFSGKPPASLPEAHAGVGSSGPTPGDNWMKPMKAMNRKQHTDNERGQSMVEFTLVLPILLVVLFGIIQFGIAFNNYVALTDAVRSGARTASVSRFSSTPAADTISRVKVSSGDLDPTKVGVTVTSTWVHGDDVVVTATYPYSISLLGVVVASGNLSSSTTERVE
jgi:Flp pilus assembly protein TadG